MRRSSRLPDSSLTNRSECCKPQQYKKRFQNRRWTDSVFFTWLTEWGDQTQDAYSSNGLTYVTNARINVGGFLEIKHLCIKLASLWARAMMWFMCMSNFNRLSSMTHKSLALFTWGYCIIDQHPVVKVRGARGAQPPASTLAPLLRLGPPC